MRLLTSILLLGLLAAFTSCQKEALDPNDTISKFEMEVEKTNFTDNYVSQIKDITVNDKIARWSENADGTIHLSREILLNLELENGKMLDFELVFYKRNENRDLLILDEDGTTSNHRNWDYISSDTEASNFYRNYDEARLIINNTVVFHEGDNEDFKVKKVKTVKINGEEKSQITLEINGGTLYGWYDPMGEFSSYYIISNGFFKGVIE